MKLIHFFLIAASLMFSGAALAQTCFSGEPGQDNYMEIQILEDGIEFTQHETSYSLDAAEVTVVDNSFAIFGKPVVFSSEGYQWAEIMNALLVYNPADKTMKVSLSLSGRDSNGFNGAVLNCR